MYCLYTFPGHYVQTSSLELLFGHRSTDLCNYLKMTNSLDGQDAAPLSNRQRRAKQHKEKAALLLEATERLIAGGHTFTELSVEKLCQEAGIGRSTYYVYFQDKGDLIRKLSEKISAEMTEGSKSWLDVVSHATREQLKLAMIETLQTYRRHQAVFTALAETASYDPEVEAAFNDLLISYTKRALQAIHAGNTRGLIRQDVDEATFLGLVWMCERVAYRMVRNGDDAQLHKAADVITTIAWRTLYEDNPGADPLQR